MVDPLGPRSTSLTFVGIIGQYMCMIRVADSSIYTFKIFPFLQDCLVQR